MLLFIKNMVFIDLNVDNNSFFIYYSELVTLYIHPINKNINDMLRGYKRRWDNFQRDGYDTQETSKRPP